MISMGPPCGRGLGVRMGFPTLEYPAPKNLKLLIALALFGALLASGRALESTAAGVRASAGTGNPAATASAVPGALYPETAPVNFPEDASPAETAFGMVARDCGAPPTAAASTAWLGPDALSPGRPALPGKTRNALIGLAALGVMALGATIPHLIGGSQPERATLGGFRIDFGFFRHTSDRASDRRGGEA